MAVPQGGLSWKATVAIAVAFFVVAVLSLPPLFGDTGAPLWRWLLPIAWAALGVLQLVSARKKYVAAKRAAPESADS